MVWTPHVTVAAVIAQDNRFLMVRECIDDKQVLNQPAGHLEAGEGLLESVRREVLEETARPFKPKGLVGIYRWQMPGRTQTYLRFCFAGDVGDPLPGRELDADIIGNEWLSAAEIRNRGDSLRSPLVQRCINDYLVMPITTLDVLHDLN